MSNILFFLFALVCRQVSSHGAVAKPSGRKYAPNINCQWCMGEKKEDGSNPPGQIRHEAQLSSPCMGTNRGDDTRPNWGPYNHIAGDFERPTYKAGQSFQANIAMDANHQGDAQWQFCPHSEAETDACFRRNIVKDWEGVNCHFNDCGAPPHKYSKSTYTETVTLPSSLPSGPGTLRWFWVCKETVEIFASCIDVNIVGGGPPTPAPAPGGTGCAATGDDCSSSSCCADGSMTCYKKDQYWATCRPECTPGVWSEDPPEYQTPWACDMLGAQGKPATSPVPAPSPGPNQGKPVTSPAPSPGPGPATTLLSGAPPLAPFSAVSALFCALCAAMI